MNIFLRSFGSRLREGRTGKYRVTVIGMCVKAHKGLTWRLGDPSNRYIGLRANTRAR